jgi:hypothetical protein
MTKRFLFSITVAVILTFSLVQQISAQGGKEIGSKPPIGRQPAQRSIVTTKTSAQMRAEMVSVYVEAEATFKYLSEYIIVRENLQKLGYGDLSDVVTGVIESRKLIEAMPDSYIELMTNSFSDPSAVSNLATGLRQMREDADFQAALERSEKWFISERARTSLGEVTNSNLRSSPSAPSFIRPSCNFSNLNNYPSATDIGIAKGFSFLAENIASLIPQTIDIPIIGIKIPSPARIIAAIAWGIVEGVVIGLEEERSNGIYCMNLAIVIQSFLTVDGKYNATILLPSSAGGFAQFMKEFVTAAIQNAKDRNIPIPMGTATDCATERLNEADANYSAGSWANAYKKYRSAYQNINASACIQ